MAILTEYKSPGVYGREVQGQTSPAALSPAKMGIVGWTDKGPSNFPIEISSVPEFTRVFGSLSQKGLVPISIRAFLGSGGERAWVSRVTPADSIAALVNIDSSPGPTKWTFTANGEGVWGNNLKVRIRGNRNFLNYTTFAWDKFDVLILQPSDFDPAIDSADEVYEAVQFTDASKFDYITNVINDPRKPSLLVKLTAGAGGVPSGLLSTVVSGESIGTGGGAPLTKRFAATLSTVPVLPNTLVIKAVSATLNNQTETPVTGTIDGSNKDFTFQVPLANLPVIEASLKLFYQRLLVSNELIPANSGLVDGTNKTFVFNAGNVDFPIHREITNFKLKYAATAGASPQTLVTIGVSPATYDLATTPLTTTPVHPGTVSIQVNVNGVGISYITDNGHGVLTGTNGSLPSNGTINYTTGAMTGTTAALTASSTVVATYNTSNVITKRAQVNLPLTTVVGTIALGDTVTVGAATGKVVRIATGQTSVDVNVISGTFAPGAASFAPSLATATVVAPVTPNNLAQLVDLIGSVDGTGINQVNLVNSETTPTSSGSISVKTLVAPIAGTNIYLDYVALGIATSDKNGLFTGDVTANSTVNFDTGAMTITFTNAPLSGSTVEASFQTGQLVRDNGLGKLVGDIDAAGNNVVDYTLGVVDVTFNTAPPSGTPVTADYVKLAEAIQFQLAGGNDGSAVSRNDISNPSLDVPGSRKGIYALSTVEEPLNLVVPDFEGSTSVQADIVDYCDNRQDRFAILGAANGTSVDEAILYNLVTQAFDTKNAAFYFPNIYFVNEVTGLPELLPCTPFVAGIYAKTARNKNVGKAPGGITDGLLDAPGTIGPELKLELQDRDNLYQSRINPLMTSAATGFVVWGVRTLSKDKTWRYVNHRTLIIFLLYRINLLLQWVVFENNGPVLWTKITTAVKGYLSSLFRLGYFAGNKESEAYFVKCDSSNNNATTIAAGQVIVDLGASPSIPAEFVVFSIAKVLNSANGG